ncbi:Tyrosine-protein kinase [Actinidia chinensis var. chinensis]|uniref:Tyrosine-protein kinase n=1 Tax=Actinidia chinensis var. chinensis TaxID=1590841 RepID=A0A2R6QB01_ACTCC|nr:Tyrosine-protein kinase [Actinidia chinensis var. chinensis]
MGVEAMRAVHAYRHLLRAVKKHVGKEDHKTHFTDFISQAFRQPSDPSSLHPKLKLATDYTFLLNSVHYHKDLLFSYNIAVDRSDEMRKVLGKSAASVGLQLPEVYQL